MMVFFIEMFALGSFSGQIWGFAVVCQSSTCPTNFSSESRYQFLSFLLSTIIEVCSNITHREPVFQDGSIKSPKIPVDVPRMVVQNLIRYCILWHLTRVQTDCPNTYSKNMNTNSH